MGLQGRGESALGVVGTGKGVLGALWAWRVLISACLSEMFIPGDLTTQGPVRSSSSTRPLSRALAAGPQGSLPPGQFVNDFSV